MHSESLIEKSLSLKNEFFSSWSNYIEHSIDVAVEVTNQEFAFPRLIYGYRTSNQEVRQVGQELDTKLANLAKQGLMDRFILLELENTNKIFAVAFCIADSLLKHSYRTYGNFMSWMIAESKKATISYLKNYLSEVCKQKGQSQPSLLKRVHTN